MGQLTTVTHTGGCQASIYTLKQTCMTAHMVTRAARSGLGTLFRISPSAHAKILLDTLCSWCWCDLQSSSTALRSPVTTATDYDQDVQASTNKSTSGGLPTDPTMDTVPCGGVASLLRPTTPCSLHSMLPCSHGSGSDNKKFNAHCASCLVLYNRLMSVLQGRSSKAVRRAQGTTWASQRPE